MKNRNFYPDDWETISHRIRFERAKGKCELCERLHGGLYWNGKRFVKIVLTAAHRGIDQPDGTPGDKNNRMDCRDENLIALCQRCHLAFDDRQHQQTAEKKKRDALHDAKQQLFSFWSKS